MDKFLNVAYSIHREYVKPSQISIYSLISNNQDIYFSIFIFSIKPFSNIIKKSYENLLDHSRAKIEFVCINETEFNKINNNDWGKETFIRIFIPNYFGSITSSLLYLDADTLVVDRIEGLIDFDFKNNYIAVCQDIKYSNKTHNLLQGLDEKNIYFNSGVILFNISLINKENIINKALQNKNLVKLMNESDLADMAFLNKVFEHRKTLLTINYNFPCTYERTKLNNNDFKFDNEIIIIHYGGSIKPWEFGYDGLFEAEFNKYKLLSKVKLNKTLKIAGIISLAKTILKNFNMYYSK